MAQQLKGTFTVTDTALTAVFMSEDGQTTYTYEAKDRPWPVVVDKIDAVLDVVEPDILQGFMTFRGRIGPAAIAIHMGGDGIDIQAQLKEAIEPPVSLRGSGNWSQSNS